MFVTIEELVKIDSYKMYCHKIRPSNELNFIIEDLIILKTFIDSFIIEDLIILYLQKNFHKLFYHRSNNSLFTENFYKLFYHIYHRRPNNSFFRKTFIELKLPTL